MNNELNYYKEKGKSHWSSGATKDVYPLKKIFNHEERNISLNVGSTHKKTKKGS